MTCTEATAVNSCWRTRRSTSAGSRSTASRRSRSHGARSRPAGCARRERSVSTSRRSRFFFQAEDGIRDGHVTGVQTCALPIYSGVARRRFLDDLAKWNEVEIKQYQDPEISTRIAQYELAFKMQSSVPELADLSKEPE